MRYEVPILFIVFRRPQIAQKSFERIRKWQPRKLYIACDGARESVEGENDLVAQTKSSILGIYDAKVIKIIPWDKSIKRLLHQNNVFQTKYLHNR